MSEQSLDDIFSGTAEAVTEAPVEEVVEQEVVEEPVEKTPEPEPEVKEEVEATAATQEKVEEESWTKKAVLDERRKRQALEAELEKLKQPKESEPDVFVDQAAYTQYVSKQVSQQVTEARVQMSQELMRMQDPEYDAKEAEFMEMAAENQELAQKVLAHSMPAKFVVDTVNKARKLKALENVDEYESKLRAEIEAKVRAEIEGENKVAQEKVSNVKSIKPSLANARPSGSDKTFIEKDLSDILGR